MASFHGKLPCGRGTMASFHGELPCGRGAMASLHGKLPCGRGAMASLHGKLPCGRGTTASFHGKLPCGRGTMASFHGKLPWKAGRAASSSIGNALDREVPKRARGTRGFRRHPWRSDASMDAPRFLACLVAVALGAACSAPCTSSCPSGVCYAADGGCLQDCSGDAGHSCPAGTTCLTLAAAACASVGLECSTQGSGGCIRSAVERPAAGGPHGRPLDVVRGEQRRNLSAGAAARSPPGPSGTAPCPARTSSPSAG